MNLLDVICEELGVEIGEIWTGNDSTSYRYESNGTMSYYNEDLGAWDEATNAPARVLIGELRPVWKPSLGEEYYIPYLGEICLYSTSIFMHDHYDLMYLHNGIVFKTKEEAIECAKKMLNAIK